MKTVSFFLLFLLNGFRLYGNGPEVVFKPSEWSFGEISRDKVIEKELHIENKSNRKLEIWIISTCECLYAEPERLQISQAGKGIVRLRFDPAEYSDKIQKTFIIRTDLEGMEKALFPVYGFVAPVEKSEQRVITGEEGKAQGVSDEVKRDFEGTGGKELAYKSYDVTIQYYYSPGCKSCLRFLKRKLPEIEKELGIKITVDKKDILTPEVYEEYLELLSVLGEKEMAFPAIIVGDRVIQGDKEIKEKLKGELNRAIDKDLPQPVSLEGKEINGLKVGEKFAVLPVILAGLLDGINPCAFTILIFLLASLAWAGRGRRDVLIIGFFFTLSVFATYLLIGLGFFKALRLTASFPIIAMAIKWVLVAVLLVFSVLSIYDYWLIRAGRARDIILQLPSTFKRQIHKSVKTHTKSTALVASSLSLGFLVSIFELACTGQVYFPTIVYLIQIKKELSGYLLLFVYNFGFIFPLVVVFALSYLGISSKRITDVFQRSMGKVKLSLAFLFLGLAVLTIFT